MNWGRGGGGRRGYIRIPPLQTHTHTSLRRESGVIYMCVIYSTAGACRWSTSFLLKQVGKKKEKKSADPRSSISDSIHFIFKADVTSHKPSRMKSTTVYLHDANVACLMTATCRNRRHTPHPVPLSPPPPPHPHAPYPQPGVAHLKRNVATATSRALSHSHKSPL